MSRLPKNRHRTIAFSALLAVVALLPSASMTAHADDIPHENYTLVQSNIDVLISMLRATIKYSEFALMAMYNESMAHVDENLTVVRGLLTPANSLLLEIQDVAESYANLSMLLPPFASLSLQMGSFSIMETSLMTARGTVVSAAKLASLTGDELLTAIEAIATVNSLILRMNQTIDDMLVSANDIIGLVVDGMRPFTDNQLIPLIEKLRDLLNIVQLEVDIAVREGIRWNATQPFIMLWLSAEYYYLGEHIVGGGYLYYNGSFVPNYEVTVLMDGGNLTSTQTSSNGRFAFSYPIPIDASWLGPHDLQATSITPSGPVNSTVVPIRILLVPTTMELSVSTRLLSYEDWLTTSVILTDVHGLAVANAPCHFILDSAKMNFTTDSHGEHNVTWAAPDLGYGVHYLQAFYVGQLPYASSVSTQVSFIIDIPTSVDVRLFASRFPVGHDYRVAGSGTLLANGSEPLPYQAISISVDGIVMENATTDAEGKFVFAIPTQGMIIGGHKLKAEFLHRESIWRFSADETGFTIYSLKQSKYPFFPQIPGWDVAGMPESFPYLFIGPYAFYFWLLILTLTGVSIKLLQLSKQSRFKKRETSTYLESLDKRVTISVAPPGFSAEELSKEIERLGDDQATPNERIVWYYQRLLAFLTRRERLSIRASMTHWEVARMLKTIGYPPKPVDRMTMLFEQAFYSGLNLSDTERVQMSASLTSLISVKKAEASRAV